MNPETTGRNQDGTFIKGVSGNPAGRPPESLNFKTKWLIFIDKIAKQNGITSDDVDEQLLAVAFKQMKSGDFRYWKDIQDRVYGTAIQNTDVTSGGQKITPIYGGLSVQGYSGGTEGISAQKEN